MLRYVAMTGVLVLGIVFYVKIREPETVAASIKVAHESPIAVPEEFSQAFAPMQDLLPAESIEDLTLQIVEDNDNVISIGEPMDPDDPSTWPQSETTEVINIGEPMDPDDHSTWPQSDSTEVINIGEPMDPDDPSTWLQADNFKVINIGEPMNPDDPSTWPQSESTEVINIGPPMDPDDPSTWPQ